MEQLQQQMDKKLIFLEQRLNHVEQQLKEGGGKQAPVQGGGMGVGAETQQELSNVYAILKKCFSNQREIHNEQKIIKKNLDLKEPQNVAKLDFHFSEEKDKPLPTFQDSNRRFFVEESSSKKVKEQFSLLDDKRKNFGDFEITDTLPQTSLQAQLHSLNTNSPSFATTTQNSFDPESSTNHTKSLPTKQGQDKTNS